MNYFPGDVRRLTNLELARLEKEILDSAAFCTPCDLCLDDAEWRKQARARFQEIQHEIGMRFLEAHPEFKPWRAEREEQLREEGWIPDEDGIMQKVECSTK